MFKRPLLTTILERLRVPRCFVQVLAGPGEGALRRTLSMYDLELILEDLRHIVWSLDQI